MPAEWEPHEATWLAWPHERTDWPGKFAPIKWVYGEIVRHLAAREKVRILVEDAAHREQARRVIQSAGAELGAVEFYTVKTNRGWLRDSGPVFTTNARGALRIVNWEFNAWAKYDDWRKDNRVPGFIARRLGIEQVKPGMVLEGGSIDVDGEGTLLTTEECLLSDVQPRNPNLSPDRIEAALRRYLGVRRVLWLGRGIAGDDTHSHVDDIARFVAPGVVLAAVEPDPGDPNHAPLKENLARLRKMRDAAGRRLRVVPLPMPEPVSFRSQRLPASYANFYIANKVVLAPVFGDPKDRAALNVLASVFADRQVIGIYSRDLVLGLGALHCLTQQQPAASSGQPGGAEPCSATGVSTKWGSPSDCGGLPGRPALDYS